MNINKISEVILVFVFIAVLIALLSAYTLGYITMIGVGTLPDKAIVKVGQVWETTYFEDNPYEDVIINQREVIGVSGKYILYIENSTDTANTRDWLFITNSSCIKNCE